MSRKTFTMEIFIDELEKKLSGLFKAAGEEHAKLVSKMIMGNLETTEVGLQQLYLSFSGIEEKVKFFPGEEVTVEVSRLHSWSLLIPDMEKAGLIVDKKMKVKVIGTNIHKKENIHIEYLKIRIPGDNPEKYDQWIDPRYLNVTEESKIARPDVGDLI